MSHTTAPSTKDKPLITADELMVYEQRLNAIYESRVEGKGTKESLNKAKTKVL